MFLIAVSGYGQEEDQQRAKTAGFDAYLVKPISLKDLEKLLAEFNGR
jgi:CheY-like chemotaxis protein